jgi:two-component system NtrC family sensor kinase
VTGEGAGDLSGITEAHLRAVFDSIPTRIALLDRARRYRYVNREYIEFAGRPAGEILGRTIAEVLAEEAFVDFDPQGERALAGETVLWSGWLEYRQGRRYLQRICAPLHDAAGGVAGYFIFNRDLTDLKHSEALNAAIIASSLDCVVAIDERGRIVEFNPAAEQTFGHRREDVLGRPIGALIVPPALRQRHAEGFARYLATGERRVLGRRVEVEGMRADGSVFPVELTITELRLQDRRLFTAHLRDLTAARAAAAEIQRQREALHQSEKLAAFGSLLAGVAHELNNPLSIVIGHALMLAEAAEHSAPALAERAQRLQAAAERCGRIVRSFLTMARQRETRMRPAAVPALIEAVLQLLAYGLTSAGISIERAIDPELPELRCDADQIQQVLSNLLINARQALEERPQPRRIRLSAGAAGDWVEIAVADNGPGIAEAIRSRIFDPFFTTKPAGAGTGIGLGISRGIAEAHGGTLTLAPARGEGACFVLRLPRQPAVAAAAAPAAAAPAARPGGTVLVVDDEPELARLLAEMLAAERLDCDVVGSGEAARSRLEQRDYDAVICDLRMPGMDGPALFAWMEAHKPQLCHRTVFVTGDTLGAAAGKFLARVGRPILEKPFVPNEVRRLLAELLPGADRRRDPAMR